MGLRRGGGVPPLCGHRGSRSMVGWMTSSGPGPRVGDRGPQGHPTALGPAVPLSPSSPIPDPCCPPDPPAPPQPTSLTPQGWEPRAGLASPRSGCPPTAPNKFPSPRVNGLGSARRETAPDLPLGQGAGIKPGTSPSGPQSPHQWELIGNKSSSSLELLNFAFLSQLELLPLPPYQPQPWYIQAQLSLLAH